MADKFDAGKIEYLLTQIEHTCEAAANKEINATYGHERVIGYIAEARAVLNTETLAQTTVRLEQARKVSGKPEASNGS